MEIPAAQDWPKDGQDAGITGNNLGPKVPSPIGQVVKVPNNDTSHR